jgi:hypothetical protein
MSRGTIRLEGSLDEVKARVRRATAVFDADAPVEASVPGRIVARSEGRVLTVVAEGENGALAQSLRALGATSVEVEDLSLEDILVALLERASTREVEHA